MRKKRLLICCAFFMFFSVIFTGCDKSEKDPKGGTIQNPGTLTLSFTGKNTSSAFIYACWIEDESGNNLQNIYVCGRAVPPQKTLTGDAIPYWALTEYPSNTDIDAVTGASKQNSLTVSRSISGLSADRIRVYFEIDRSWNGNNYFADRPSFIYCTDLIDLNSTAVYHDFDLSAWMSNDTAGGNLSQQPKNGVSIPGFEQYKLMTDVSFIAPRDDMVESISVTLEK